ncbi:MAG: DUF397 domain-containing protein [Sciscionella sp.]
MLVCGASGGGDRLWWRKSSYSGAGNDCVEVAYPVAAAAAVRDSKNPRGGTLQFDERCWRSFLHAATGRAS